MNIQIQIEQLILEEIELTPGQRSRLQAAVEAELSRLIAAEKFPIDARGGFISKLPITVNATELTHPEFLGTSIARCVYAQLKR